MKKKSIILSAFMVIAALLLSTVSYANHIQRGDFIYGQTSSTFSSSSFDVSIDRVTLNNEVVVESRTNLIDDSNEFSVIVDITAVKDLVDGHIEVSLRSTRTGETVADSTTAFDLKEGHNSKIDLDLILIDDLKDEEEFELRVIVEDSRERTETKNYRVRTESQRFRSTSSSTSRGLDVSIDKVTANGQVIIDSNSNFIKEEDFFNVIVEFTTLEELEDAHVEAIIKDLQTGTVVADASNNFDLSDEQSSIQGLRLVLVDEQKDSERFELTIKIIDAKGDFTKKTYGLVMDDAVFSSSSNFQSNLGISIDSVEIEKIVVIENEDNLVDIDGSIDKLDVNVRLTSLENIENARVEAILYLENGNVVSDKTITFDLDNDVSILKKLDLELPSFVDEFSVHKFSLKIKVIEAKGDFEEKVYGVVINQNRLPFTISSIELDPETKVKAGSAVNVKVSIQDSGILNIDKLALTVSIPELGIIQTKLVQINDNLAYSTSDFILKVLDTADTGKYTVKAEASTPFGRNSISQSTPLYVIAGEKAKEESEGLLVQVPNVKRKITNDGKEAIYPVSFKNIGTSSETYSLKFESANWATVRLSDSSTFVLSPEESRTINIFVSTKTKVAGDQSFIVTVKNDEKIAYQTPLVANVEVLESKILIFFMGLLKLTLIVLVIFLAAAGLYLGTKKFLPYIDREQNAAAEEIPDSLEGEAYY
jgi:hypothetical protein